MIVLFDVLHHVAGISIMMVQIDYSRQIIGLLLVKCARNERTDGRQLLIFHITTTITSHHHWLLFAQRQQCDLISISHSTKTTRQSFTFFFIGVWSRHHHYLWPKNIFMIVGGQLFFFLYSIGHFVWEFDQLYSFWAIAMMMVMVGNSRFDYVCW